MLFSSIIFIFYFLPITLILYYGASFSRKLQNAILLILSLIFYTFGETKYILIMLSSIIINYIFALLIDKHREKGKVLLILACIANLGILFVFKYLTFVIRNINDYSNMNLYIPNIVLPIGISFFTFQALSYVIDIYRNDVKVKKNIFYLALYISFFPQLIAGPIVRYSTIEEQIKNRRESFKLLSVGICRFIVGLGKKVLIANSMAVIVDRIYEIHSISAFNIPATLAWLGSICYTFQIYYDFSAYSDMAIGLGQMFGFKFPENFNYPYISKSISEFWRRWHISLGSWFRDYVYFPLGGSRVKNKDKIIRNLFVVWLLTGIWHGAEWTFVIWGLINFACISFEKLIDFENVKIKPIFRHIYALFIINLGWVIFRSKDLFESGKYISNMFGLNNNGFYNDYVFMFVKENIVFLILAVVFSMPVAKRANKFMIDEKPFSKVFQFVYPLALVLLFMISISYLVKGTYNPFIYFNF